MIANSGIVNTAVFTCNICGEPSTNICAYCTKDACGNHRCERCKRCSDCCECDVPLSAEEAVAETVREAPAEVTPEAAVEPPPTFESSVFAEPGVFAEPPDITDPPDNDGPVPEPLV
jgi:hypothetical protein